jgi:ABC-type multidrug transport system fused ATPase/permease subunit
MRFLSTLGQLPGTWKNLLLIVLSGTVEGIGLTLFIPLLNLMSGESIEGFGTPFSSLTDFIESSGLNVNPLTLLILITVLTLASLLLGYIQRKMLIKSKQVYSRDLRNKFFNGILDSNWQYSSGRAHGEIANQLNIECSRAGVALGMELLAMATAIQIVVYFAFSIIISWELVSITVIFILLAYLVVRPVIAHAKILGEETSIANRNISFYAIEYLRSLKLLKATGAEEMPKKHMFEHSDVLNKVSFQSELNTTRVYFLVQALPVILLTSIIGISFELIETPTSLILVFLLFMARTAPRVAQFQQQLNSFHLASPAIRIVNQMVAESSKAIENLNPTGILFESIKEEVTIKDVSFKYKNGETLAVDRVSLKIPRNKIIAIVGSSGAGKSTIMDLLCGLYVPDSGKVVIDGTDLRKFNIASWRKKIGIVTQDLMIFNASLRDNLTYFNQGASEEKARWALSIAHLDDVITNLSDGMDTILGENGHRLSGGQKQRIALARALARDPNILLLDEATSALDNESERYIQQAIESIAHKTTIVVIAHRLSTVRRADVIHVMEKGGVVESGTYEQLLEKGGRFKELHEIELS